MEVQAALLPVAPARGMAEGTDFVPFRDVPGRQARFGWPVPPLLRCIHAGWLLTVIARVHTW